MGRMGSARCTATKRSEPEPKYTNTTVKVFTFIVLFLRRYSQIHNIGPGNDLATSRVRLVASLARRGARLGLAMHPHPFHIVMCNVH